MTVESAVPETEAAERDARLVPQFRALPIAGGRKAFRLERVFWSALQSIAQRNGRTLAEEVAATLERLPGGVNDAAVLRASVAADLFDLWQVAASRHAAIDWSKVLGEMPTPAFAILTTSQNLVTANRALLERLRTLGVGAYEPGAVKLEGLSVSVDPGVITQIGKKGAYLDCNVAFKSGASRVVRRARLGPAGDGPAARALVIGFVEP